MEREELLHHLKFVSKVLEKEELEQAFRDIDRADFLHPDYVPEAYEDYAVPIGHDATLSQPTTVAFMLELLDPLPGEKVLDVGSGSGYTTSLLAKLVGDEGYVWGTEIVPELVSFGKANMQKYNFKNAEIREAGDTLGFPQEEGYDKILVNAEAEEIPEELLAQLRSGGVMVIPVNGSIVRVEKNSDDEIETREFPGFSFVPLK